jgi:hypothetical protein
MAVALATNTMAQDVLFDIDFSSTEWLDALGTTLDTDMSTAAYPIDIGSEITVNSFKINRCHIIKETPSYPSVCGRTFGYAVRFKANNSMSYIEFPVVANAGKITVYAAHGNNAASTTIDLGRKESEGEGGEFINDPAGGWRPNFPIKRWDVQGYDSYVDDESNQVHDIRLTYEINTDEPIALRLCRQSGTFLKIYRIVLEEYVNVPNAVSSSFSKKAGLSVIGKTLSLPEAMNNAKLSIFDLAGKQVLNSSVNSDKVELNLHAGVYIVKLIAEQDEMTQKIIVR